MYGSQFESCLQSTLCKRAEAIRVMDCAAVGECLRRWGAVIYVPFSLTALSSLHPSSPHTALDHFLIWQLLDY